jgi:hypothetical protein
MLIMLVVIVAALPTHLFLLTRAIGPTDGTAAAVLEWAGGIGGTAVSLVIVALLGCAATVLPLAVGLRAFRRLEP